MAPAVAPRPTASGSAPSPASPAAVLSPAAILTTLTTPTALSPLLPPIPVRLTALHPHSKPNLFSCSSSVFFSLSSPVWLLEPSYSFPAGVFLKTSSSSPSITSSPSWQLTISARTKICPVGQRRVSPYCTILPPLPVPVPPNFRFNYVCHSKPNLRTCRTCQAGPQLRIPIS